MGQLQLHIWTNTSLSDVFSSLHVWPVLGLVLTRVDTWPGDSGVRINSSCYCSHIRGSWYSLMAVHTMTDQSFTFPPHNSHCQTSLFSWWRIVNLELYKDYNGKLIERTADWQFSTFNKISFQVSRLSQCVPLSTFTLHIKYKYKHYLSNLSILQTIFWCFCCLVFPPALDWRYSCY